MINILSKINKSLTVTLKRFYLPILSSIFATILAIILFETNFEDIVKLRYAYLLHISVLAIPSFISVVIVGERYKFSFINKLLLNLGIFGLLVLYYFLLPNYFAEQVIYRGILFTIAIHLIVSYLPFLKKGEFYNFWEYNKKLFERVIITTLYSMVIYGGISIAVLVANYLFDLDIEERLYYDLWVFVVGIFATIFFLSGFPKEYESEDIENTYPVGLKIFTQFVLLPLVTIYFLILYVYIAKILLNGEIPQGITSYLVVIFSILGIFSLLLIYPVQYSTKNRWIRIFAKIFYWAIFPLIILLLISIFKRINQYGVTENRYFILALALWLSGISIFLLINKLENIKIIPISLSIIALLSAFGPWGAFHVSKSSQLKILKKNLEELNIVVDGKINKKFPELSNEESNKISNSVYYIVKNYGYKNILEIVDLELDSSLTKNQVSRSYDLKYAILDSLGVSNYYNEYNDYQEDSNRYNFNFSTPYEDFKIAKDVKEYDFYTNVSMYSYTDAFANETIYFEESSVSIEISDKLSLKYKDNVQVYKFSELIDKLYKKYSNNNYGIEENDLTILLENNNYKIKFEIKSLEGSNSIEDKKLVITNFSANIYFKLKELDVL